MLLSKEIRDTIFKTPKIIRKLEFTADLNNKEDQLVEFLTNNGKFIKNMRLLDDCSDINLLGRYLILVPNLETLTHEWHKDVDKYQEKQEQQNSNCRT